MFGLMYLFFLQILLGQEIHSIQNFYGRNFRRNLNKLDSEYKTYIKEEWFPQFLDHFNPQDVRTWKQRYFTNIQHYNQGGPIFLLISGEEEAEIGWMTNGTWINYAKRFGALCFQLEHRYYGESHPTTNLSTENLQYFSIQQALADLAVFIVAMNKKYDLPRSTKWIAFGGSYPGALSAWLRLKYPHLVHGAVSSSGTILQQLEYSDYLKVSVEALGNYSNKCVSSIGEATSEFHRLLQDGNGLKEINKMFRLCTPIENSLKNQNDIITLYWDFAMYFGCTVQNNQHNAGFLGPDVLQNITIKTMCDIMVNKELGSPLNRLAVVNNRFLSAFDKKCLAYNYSEILQELKNTDWNQDSESIFPFGRQWLYQVCSGTAAFQTTSSTRQVFGNVPVQYFIQQCTDVFGDEYNLTFINNAVNKANTIFGGTDIDVTNVAFVQGSFDPWRNLGLTKTIKKGAPVIYIEGTSHVADMFPESDKDLPQLKDARKKVANYIEDWLRQ